MKWREIYWKRGSMSHAVPCYVCVEHRATVIWQAEEAEWARGPDATSVPHQPARLPFRSAPPLRCRMMRAPSDSHYYHQKKTCYVTLAALLQYPFHFGRVWMEFFSSFVFRQCSGVVRRLGKIGGYGGTESEWRKTDQAGDHRGCSV